MMVTAVQHYTRAINSGALSQEYLAVVYRYRSDSYAALGDQKRAIADNDYARQLMPEDSVLEPTPAAGAKLR